MELNWTTFTLEAVNFLVLVWILKRFLYKPVLEAISQRKATIDKAAADARARQSEAQALGEQYENRLADWEHEKERLRTTFLEEISQQRAQMMTALDKSLAKERERARALEERRLKGLQDKAETQGIAIGLKFTARILARLASPELEKWLLDLALEDLSHQPSDRIEAIRAAFAQVDGRATVTSSFPLPAAERAVLVKKLQEVTPQSITVQFNEDNRLLAGLRIGIGPWILRANLQDELGFFATMVPHAS